MAIENAAIEDETDGLKLVDIKFQSPAVAGARFHQGVVVDNDQDFVIDGMTNLGGGDIFRANANFVGNMVYIRGDQGAAAVPYIHHLEASMQCGGNGIRNVAGNTMHVTDSVIQGTSQYSIYYGNGMNPWEIDNVYYETGTCTNPAYAAGSYAAEAGYISNTASSLSIQGNAPIGGAFPSFASGGGAGSQRNYYIVAHDTNKGVSPLLAIGTAQPATSGTSIPLYWPNMDLGGGGNENVGHPGDAREQPVIGAVHGECIFGCDECRRGLQHCGHLHVHGHAGSDHCLYGEQRFVGTVVLVLAGVVRAGKRRDAVHRSGGTDGGIHSELVSSAGICQAVSGCGRRSVVLLADVDGVLRRGFDGQRQSESGGATGADRCGERWSSLGSDGQSDV